MFNTLEVDELVSKYTLASGYKVKSMRARSGRAAPNITKVRPFGRCRNWDVSISFAGGLSDTVASASVRFMILFTGAAACESAFGSLESLSSLSLWSAPSRLQGPPPTHQ